MTPDDIYPLDDDSIELIAEIQTRGAALRGEMTGVLNAFLKRQKISGRWVLAENGREIQKAAAPAMLPVNEGSMNGT